MKMKKNFGFIMAVAALVMLLRGAVRSLLTRTRHPLIRWRGFQSPGIYTSTTAGDLWTLLQNTGGGIPPSGTEEEPTFEGYYVLVTGRHGCSALYSVGELDPKFAPANAVTITLDKYGRYDLAGEGRSVEEVCTIDLVHAVPVIKAGSTYSPARSLFPVRGSLHGPINSLTWESWPRRPTSTLPVRTRRRDQRC